MFKIGEFSRLAGVSAKALRHYDQLSLFRPVWVDPTSGYRFYSPAQLPELYRIAALKDLGISLGEISGLLDGGEDLYQILRQKRVELEAERKSLERKQAALDIRVDMDGSSGHPDIVLRGIGAELIAGLRVVVGPGDSLEPVFDELEAYVRDAAARAARPPMTLVHGEDGSSRDLEVCVPLYEPVPSTPEITCRRLAAGRAVALITRGSYKVLPAARESLDEWMAAAGLEPVGPLRIVYLQFGADPSLRLPDLFLADDARDFVTELQQEVAS